MASQVGLQDAWLEARKDILLLHSPYHFLRDISITAQQERFGVGAARRFGQRPDEERITMTGEASGEWLLQKLGWDTNYFGVPTYRLFTGLFDQDAVGRPLKNAAIALKSELESRGEFYAFSAVPAEDITLLQALTGAGWHLVETRLTFYADTLSPLALPSYPVRVAHADEAVHLGQVAAAARNIYDRFHADPWFGTTRADAFLARYAEAAVTGTYADAVLVPNEKGLPIDSFLAISQALEDSKALASGFARVLLTAVGPQNRGWHVKLVAETLRWAAGKDLSYVLMTTQATNRAVFRTCEKLGFRLGNTTHIVACHAT